MAIELHGLRTKKDRNEILDELRLSASANNVLGLFLDGEDEMVTTAVCKVEETSAGILIHFEKTDLHGYPLEKNPVMFDDVKSVIHFQTLFSDPVYVRIRQRRAGESDKFAA